MTLGVKTLFILLVDDKSRFMWLILLQAKSESAEAIKHIQARVEAECGKKMQVLCTDGEFTSVSFCKYCNELGMQRHLTTPYSPQQNGVVECQNQTIVGIVRSLLMMAKMLGRFWGVAVTTATSSICRQCEALTGRHYTRSGTTRSQRHIMSECSAASHT